MNDTVYVIMKTIDSLRRECARTKRRCMVTTAATCALTWIFAAKEIRELKKMNEDLRAKIEVLQYENQNLDDRIISDIKDILSQSHTEG